MTDRLTIASAPRAKDVECIAAGLNAGERAVLMQLSHNRPTEDGDIIGKQSRDALIRLGLAYRSFGFTTLTRDGIAAQVYVAEQEATRDAG